MEATGIASAFQIFNAWGRRTGSLLLRVVPSAASCKYSSPRSARSDSEMAKFIALAASNLRLIIFHFNQRLRLIPVQIEHIFIDPVGPAQARKSGNRQRRAHPGDGRIGRRSECRARQRHRQQSHSIGIAGMLPASESPPCERRTAAAAGSQPRLAQDVAVALEMQHGAPIRRSSGRLAICKPSQVLLAVQIPLPPLVIYRNLSVIISYIRLPLCRTPPARGATGRNRDPLRSLPPNIPHLWRAAYIQ